MVETDVVVVGFGAAGSAAAIEASDAGADVVVVDKMPEDRAGGNTRVSGSIWFDNRDPDRAADYLRSLCGPYPVPEPVVHAWSRETALNTAWIESLGAHVMLSDYHQEPEFPDFDGSDCYGGYLHIPPTVGMSRLFETLSRAVRERGVDVQYESAATALVRSETDGSIAGVRVGDDDRFIRARRAVVLASGGFGNNPAMIRDYLGLPTAVSVGTPANTGDGIRLAESVGADLWHMTNYMPFIAIHAPELGCAVRLNFAHSTGYIWVGTDGTRFGDESVHRAHGHALRNGRYELFPNQPMHIVFDEKTRCAGPLASPPQEAPHSWSILMEGYAWSADNSAEIERGWIRQAASVAELALLLGMEPSVLVRTIDEYNGYCEEGLDRRFDRDPRTLVTLDEPPYYACAWGPSLVYTCGGPRRNERAQVLDTAGHVIPRLYCAGEISSTYSYCMDGGMMIADALAFGRIAGRHAAAETALSRQSVE